ncbi:SDR family NAD(P)-dependent oxidoreductase [Thermococcus sp.]
MRTALVTGATGGIGKFLVKALIDEGYRVIGVGRRWKKLKKLKALGDFDYIVEDLNELGSVGRIAKALRELGIVELDLLVNTETAPRAFQ